jgi:hypothetical protein
VAYTTPVTDRALSDIQTPTSKGHWNVDDFERVYGNSQLVSSLAAIMLDTTIAFDTLTAPTITTIPAVADFNTFLANIENVRVAVDGESIPGTSVSIKDDYSAGPGEDAPDYTDANLWELVIDVIWVYFNGPSLDICPTLTADLTITNGNQEIYVDCLDTNGFNVDLQGSAKLYII